MRRHIGQVIGRQLLALCAVSLAAGVASAQYQLVWHDEFDGIALDPTKWEVQLGNGCPNLCGWGNNELQSYRAENATVSGGVLRLTARRENSGGSAYTSARVRSKLRGDWLYGRFEARAKVPTGRGLWPAFWLLPTDERYGGWASSGEIDVLEILGHQPAKVYGTLHYGGTWPANTSGGSNYTLPAGTFADDFHVFALEWTPTRMRWFVDGVQFAERTSWWSAGGPYPAPFDERFHLLLNLAVGGDWPGAPDPATIFPQAFEVDYVRVYQDLANGGACRFPFDEMEHAAPLANGYFDFDAPGASGGIAATLTNTPPGGGGVAALSAAWTNGGTPGYLGGFGRTFPLDVRSATHFELWLDPAAGQDFTLELNLQDDDDGDDVVPGQPDGRDDEFQYALRVAPTGGELTSGGGWQRVSIPLEHFTDDNSHHFGGNGILDLAPVSAGGNGRLVNVVVALVSHAGGAVSFTTDSWRFVRRRGELAGVVWDDANGDGQRSAQEGGLAGVRLVLFDRQLGIQVATTVTEPDGAYSFLELIDGEYEVRVVEASLPPTSIPTADPDGTATPHNFRADLDCDQVREGQDVGYRTSLIGLLYCSPAAQNSTGGPGMAFATGSVILAQDDVRLWARSLPASSLGYFIAARGQVSVPGAGGSQGTLCVGPGVGRVVGGVIFTATNGQASVQADLDLMPTPSGPVAVQSGESWHFQAWYRDANPTVTSNFTNAVVLTLL
jgi:beta-glucanase (GH16 family)